MIAPAEAIVSGDGPKQPPDSEDEAAKVGADPPAPEGPRVHSQGRPAPGIGIDHPRGPKPRQGRPWSISRGSIRDVLTSAPPGRDPDHESLFPGAGRPWLLTPAPPGRNTSAVDGQIGE